MAPSNATAFMDAVAARRSIYALTKDAPVSDSRVIELVKQAMLNVPSAFNLQPIRAVVLLHEEHEKFWQLANDTVPKVLGTGEQAERTKGRTEAFKAGSGSVLLFTDNATNAQAQANMPALAHFFPEWAAHSQGMHQFTIWTALEAEGFGANLQHYQFLGQDFLKEALSGRNIPEDWQLVAQVVFGGRGDVDLKEKQMKDVSETVKVFGAK